MPAATAPPPPLQPAASQHAQSSAHAAAPALTPPVAARRSVRRSAQGVPDSRVASASAIAADPPPAAPASPAQMRTARRASAAAAAAAADAPDGLLGGARLSVSSAHSAASLRPASAAPAPSLHALQPPGTQIQHPRQPHSPADGHDSEEHDLDELQALGRRRTRALLDPQLFDKISRSSTSVHSTRSVRVSSYTHAADPRAPSSARSSARSSMADPRRSSVSGLPPSSRSAIHSSSSAVAPLSSSSAKVASGNVSLSANIFSSANVSSAKASSSANISAVAFSASHSSNNGSRSMHGGWLSTNLSVQAASFFTPAAPSAAAQQGGGRVSSVSVDSVSDPTHSTMTDTIHPATTPAAYDPSPLALALPLATISASSLGSIGSHRSDSSVSRRGTQSGPHHTLTVTGSQATSSGAGAQAPASTSAAATTAAATLGRTSSESRASMTSKSELEEAADTVRPLTANHTTKRRRSRSQGSASEDTATFSPIISPTFDPYAGAVPGENYCLYPGPRPRSSSTPAAFQAPRSLQASAASLPLREYSTKSSHHFSSSKADLNASGIQRRNTEQYKTRRSWFARWFGCCATVQPGDIITVRVTPDDAYGSPT